MNVLKFANKLKLETSNNLTIIKINTYLEKNNIIITRYIKPSINVINLDLISGVNPMNGTDNGYFGTS